MPRFNFVQYNLCGYLEPNGVKPAGKIPSREKSKEKRPTGKRPAEKVPRKVSMERLFPRFQK